MLKLLSSDATILVAMKKKALILIAFFRSMKCNNYSIFFLFLYRPSNSVIGLASSQLDFS